MTMRRLLPAALFLQLLVASYAALTPQQALQSINGLDYSLTGPCPIQTFNMGPQTMTKAQTGCEGLQCNLVSAVVALPDPADASSSSSSSVSSRLRVMQEQGCPAGPWPIIAFFNDAQAPSADYRAYVAHLVSYGFAVIQYETATPVPDTVELPFVHVLLGSLQQQAAAAAHPLHGRIDFAKIGVAGHSRGGRLAALQLAHNASVYTAFLMDPVDNLRPSLLNPSAVKALSAAKPQKFAAVSASGIASQCNPPAVSGEAFFPPLSQSSWLQLIKQAGHNAYRDNGLASLAGVLGVCGRGTLSPELVREMAAPVLAAWFDYFWRGKALKTFSRWAQAYSDKGAFTLEMKTVQ